MCTLSLTDVSPPLPSRWSATAPAKHGILPGPQRRYTYTEAPSHSRTELGSTNPQEGG